MDGLARRHDCDICRGRGTVTLPVYGKVMAYSPAETPTLEESSRDYPCPECGDSAPMEKLAIIQRQSGAAERPDDPEYSRYLRKIAAVAFVDELLKRDLIRIERGPADDMMRFSIRSTLGVVAPAHVATLERRVAEHQEIVAREVAAKAAAEIDNWGSYYDYQVIRKERAVTFVQEALAAVLKKRGEWKKL